MDKPYFLITIDTEGDNQWGRGKKITTRNAEFLPRFQSLCEHHGLKPTYLTNYEMSVCPAFIELGRGVLKRGSAEIGMHLHAWNSPPLFSLTADDYRFHPYLMEYPEAVMVQKIDYLTKLLEDTFSTQMMSHRAGRWGFNEVYARILVAHGYRVDCSVTPFVSWRLNMGDPAQKGGSDYTAFPRRPYWVDLDDLRHPGNSPLLEIPVSIVSRQKWFFNSIQHLSDKSLLRRAFTRIFPIHWLRPTGNNLKNMLKMVDRAVYRKEGYLEFMLHSSELMPGGSLTFKTGKDIEKLYRDLEILFSAAGKQCTGATLQEFYRAFKSGQNSSVREKS